MLSGIPRDPDILSFPTPKAWKRQRFEDAVIRGFACFRGGTAGFMSIARVPRKHATQRLRLDGLVGWVSRPIIFEEIGGSVDPPYMLPPADCRASVLLGYAP